MSTIRGNPVAAKERMPTTTRRGYISRRTNLSDTCENAMKSVNRNVRKYAFIFLSVWIIVSVVNAVMLQLGLDTDTPLFFPISIFSFDFSWAGLPWIAAFIVIFEWALRKDRLPPVRLYAIGLALIITGNMAAGSIESSIVDPIARGDKQYYHDAVEIDDASQWLATFNRDQLTHRVHTITHPPFVVLFVRAISGGQNPLAAGLSIAIMSALAVIGIYYILLLIAGSSELARTGALLYAVIPSINIYSMASIDAIVSLSFLAVLGGIVRIYFSSGTKWSNGALIVTGLIIAHAMTYAALFLWAVLGILALERLYARRNADLIWIGTIGLAVTACGWIWLKGTFEFDYVRSFLVASQYENPGGFMLATMPLRYLMTRVEGVFEILLFYSVPLTAVTYHAFKSSLVSRKVKLLSICGVAVLMMMFLSGAYKTGETARACLFIVPYMLIALHGLSIGELKQISRLVVAQTVIMQMLGNYFW